MPRRFEGGSAGDVDYARIGDTYANYRQPDSIEALIAKVLMASQTAGM